MRSDNGHPVLEVGVNARVPTWNAVLMGFQNVFVMTGIFVFPGIMGKAFHLPVETTAYLYAATFIGCGATSLLIAVAFGRMPLVAGPYAGIFTALLTFGKTHAGLGSAFGSLAVASLLWAALSVPIRGVSPISLISRVIRTPVIAGVIVMLVMMQVADLSFPHWLGVPGDKSFGLLNVGAGLVTALVLMSLICTRQPILRRLALLISLIAGAVLFEAFAPIDFSPVARSPWFVAPRLFPFGFGFSPEFCVVDLVILIAVNVQTMTLMGVVAEWTGEPMPPARLSGGVLAMMLGSAFAAAIGSFTSLPYPANVAILRSSGVASRWVTATTGVILIVMGVGPKRLAPTDWPASSVFKSRAGSAKASPRAIPLWSRARSRSSTPTTSTPTGRRAACSVASTAARRLLGFPRRPVSWSGPKTMRRPRRWPRLCTTPSPNRHWRCWRGLRISRLWSAPTPSPRRCAS
jgi:xanthine/uracil permease